MRWPASLLAFAAFTGAIAGCVESSPAPAPVAAAAPLPTHLRDTGLDAAGVLPFAPQYPLWTDAAPKRRWAAHGGCKVCAVAQPGDTGTVRPNADDFSSLPRPPPPRWEPMPRRLLSGCHMLSVQHRQPKGIHAKRVDASMCVPHMLPLAICAPCIRQHFM